MTGAKAKNTALKKAGLDPRRARDAEKLATIPTAKMDAYIRKAESPSVGGALVQFGIRRNYRYGQALVTWRDIALEAVTLLEQTGLFKNETAGLRFRCGKGIKAEGML